MNIQHETDRKYWIIAYRYWPEGKINFGIESLVKKTTIVCVSCYDSDSEKHTYTSIARRSETGEYIKRNSPKCATCNKLIRVKSDLENMRELAEKHQKSLQILSEND